MEKERTTMLPNPKLKTNCRPASPPGAGRASGGGLGLSPLLASPARARISIRAALGLLLWMAWTMPAAAEVIHSTFGPANAFDPTRWKPINFRTSPDLYGNSLAFAFEVPGRSDYQFQALSIAASWEGTRKNAQFALFADAGGLPAAGPLEVVATNPESLPRSVGAVIRLTSPGQPILRAGRRYWLVCQPASLDASVPATDFVQLWLNSAGIRGQETVRSSDDPASWGAWFDPAIEEVPVAFSIEARAVSRGNFGGSDHFNDNAMDTNRWAGPQVFSGAGFLTEKNQRLEFTSTGGSGDICLVRWAVNAGSSTEDWELKVDTTVGMPSFQNDHQNVHLNLVVSPSTNISPNQIFSIEFGRENRGYLHCEVVSSSGRTILADTNTTATNVSLRIAYDSATKRLSAHVDEDGARCGYSWKPMGSAVVPTGWKVDSNGFSAVLLGIAHFVAVGSSDNVFFDHFQAASGPVPKLRIERHGSGVAMTWPTNAPDFQLETTASLSVPICWSGVTTPVTTVSSNFTVIDPGSSLTRYFRLGRMDPSE